MADIEVKRWRRYGKDRLYVNSASGVSLGWCDLMSGETRILITERGEDVQHAIDAWRAAREPAPSAPTGNPVSPVSDASRDADRFDRQVTPIEPDIDRSGIDDTCDLVWNQAGSAAREQAHALEQGAPIQTWLARLSGTHTEERAWRIGAHGEVLVAERLMALRRRDPSWGFLHAVPVGDRGSDIDHLVVGPGGVFTLNTKNHPGGRIWVGGDTVMVNGHRVPYVRNSRFEAQRAGRLLSRATGMHLEVVPLIVFVGLPDITVASQPEDVHILRARSLVKWFMGQPVVLARPSVEAIYEAARRSTTWRGGRS